MRLRYRILIIVKNDVNSIDSISYYSSMRNVEYWNISVNIFLVLNIIII